MHFFSLSKLYLSKFIPNCTWNSFSTYYWSQMSVEIGFVPRALHTLLVSFTDSKKKSNDDKFHDHVMSQSFLREGASQFVCKFKYSCCFAFSSETQFKICYREEFDRGKIHRIYEICIKLATFEEFATAVVQTEAKRCLSSCDHFFLIHSLNHRWAPWPEKTPFQQTSRIDVNIKWNRHFRLAAPETHVHVLEQKLLCSKKYHHKHVTYF